MSLRWARAVLIGTVAFGCLAIAGGLLVAGGAWLYPGPKKPSVSPAPQPERFSIQVAEKWLPAHASDLREIDQAAASLGAPGQVPERLSALFPSPPYPTEDVWETYCKVTSEYGCLQKSRRLATPSAARTFSALFKGVEESRKNELVDLLAAQLPGIPVEKRLGMVAPILLSYVELENRNQEAASAHEKKMKEAEDTFAADVLAHHEEQMTASMAGLWVALWGFCGVVSASIFIALLAIERHLRALRSRSGV
ncbi:MAG TPA: hypothetical protein VG944_04610 [Fimbriimonas sp.]|nr:hypothetical protein [Fimbriimonas sp.]